MKLLNCLKCHDIRALVENKFSVCNCGASSGRYINQFEAEYSGPSRILGISNYDYVKSIKVETKLDERGNSTPRWGWFVILEGRNIHKK